jgi:hypothetical protein
VYVAECNLKTQVKRVNSLAKKQPPGSKLRDSLIMIDYTQAPYVTLWRPSMHALELNLSDDSDLQSKPCECEVEQGDMITNVTDRVLENRNVEHCLLVHVWFPKSGDQGCS